MIRGLEVFKNYFRSFNDQYVIIGGAACDIVFSEANSSFRATKDIDMVKFTEAFERNPPDMKSLGIIGVTGSDVADILKRVYKVI